MAHLISERNFVKRYKRWVILGIALAFLAGNTVRAMAYQKTHGLFKKRLLPHELTPIQHLFDQKRQGHAGQSSP